MPARALRSARLAFYGAGGVVVTAGLVLPRLKSRTLTTSVQSGKAKTTPAQPIGMIASKSAIARLTQPSQAPKTRVR